MSKLTHGDLIQAGTLLGYNSFTDGVCQGFSCMWAQALLAQDEERFFNRLDLIASYKPDFAALISDLEAAKKKARQSSQLTQKDNDLLEILAFFDGIKMYLNPYEYLDLFNRGHVSQNDLQTLYPFLKSKKLEHSNLNILFNKDHIFSKASLAAFLHDLEGQLKETAREFPILLSNVGHSVCLKYSKAKQKWFYIDTNDFKRYPDTTTYFRELETTELVSSLFESLSHTCAANVLCNMTMFSADNQNSELDAIKASLTELASNYPVTSEVATHSDSRQLGLLYMACLKGDLSLVQLLLDNPLVEVNQASSDGVTPLYIACQNGHSAVVAQLLKHPKIEINQATTYGFTPLFIACRNGHFAVITELLKHPNILVNQITNDGRTPLYFACQIGNLAAVTELLKHPGIMVNQARSNGATALNIACQQGHLAIVAELLKHPDLLLNQAGIRGATPLYIACQNGHSAVVAELLKHPDILINQAIDDGATPLYIACQIGLPAVVAELLKHPNLSINKPINSGATALFIACQIGHLAIVRELLKHPNLLINQGRNEGATALFIACQKGHFDVVTELLKHPDIEVNQAKNDGITPLFTACQNNQFAVVELLLKTPGIDINSQGWTNYTPLLIACLSPQTKNNEKLFQLLLTNKASLSHKNDKGQTALEIAFEQNNTAALSVMLKFIRLRSMTPSALMSPGSLEKALDWNKAQCPEVAKYLATSQSTGRSIKFFTEPTKRESSNDESLAPRQGK